MQDTIKDWLRVLFKTAASALVGWLVAVGIDVPPDFEVSLVVVLAGLANVVLNGVASWLLAWEGLPGFMRTLILFLWTPPSYQQP